MTQDPGGNPPSSAAAPPQLVAGAPEAHGPPPTSGATPSPYGAPPASSAPWSGRDAPYRFDGEGAELLGVGLVNQLIAGVTCQIARIVGYTSGRRKKWIIERRVVEGCRIAYDPPLGDSIVHALKCWGLRLVTLGLAWPVTRVWDERFDAHHSRLSDGRRTKFEGDIGEAYVLWILDIVTKPLLFLGLGVFLYPWREARDRGWVVRNTFLEDGAGGWRRLAFDGTGMSYLVTRLTSLLLTLLTLGLYGPWADVRFEKWAASLTRDERRAPRRPPMGPQTPVEWIVVAASGLSFLAPIVLFVVLVGATGAAVAIAKLREVTGIGRDAPAPSAAAPSPPASQAPEDARPARNVTACAVARASSEQPRHPASHAFDGKTSTAWNENAKGDGTGEWVEATLPPGSFLSYVEVSGGWAQTSGGLDLWAHNNSFRVMRVSWEGGSTDVAFSRTADRGVKKRVEVGARVTTIRFTALEVDRGKFDDLCLDEILLHGDVSEPCGR